MVLDSVRTGANEPRTTRYMVTWLHGCKERITRTTTPQDNETRRHTRVFGRTEKNAALHIYVRANGKMSLAISSVGAESCDGFWPFLIEKEAGRRVKKFDSVFVKYCCSMTYFFGVD